MFAAAAKDLPAQKVAAQAENVPTSPNFLQRQAPESQNAALFYRQASDLIGKDRSLLKTVENRNSARLVAELDRFAKPLALVEQGARLHNLDFHLSPGALADAGKEYENLGIFAELLMARSKARLAAADTAGSLADLRATNAIASQLLDIPSVAAEGTAKAILDEEFLQIQSRLSETSLYAFQTGIHGMVWPKAKPWNFYVAADFVSTLAAVSHLGEPGYVLEERLGSKDSFVPKSVAAEFVREAYSARLIAFERDLCHTLKQPAPLFADTVTEIKSVEAAHTPQDPTFDMNRHTHDPAVYCAIGPAIKAQEMLLKLGTESIAALSANWDKVFPPDISKTRDPFDLSRPFHAQRASPGFVIYSVGPNGLDDGGGAATDDITFTYPKK